MAGQPDDLGDLRAEIDDIDDSIADLILDRIDLAEEAGEVKTNEGKDIVDESREEIVKSRYEERFREQGVAGEHGRELAECLIRICLDQERKIDNTS